MAAPAATVAAIRYRLLDLSATSPLLATGTTLQAAIDAAVAKYSQDRPRTVVEDEPGDTSGYYVLVGTGAVLAAWSDGFSSIQSIEYPAAAVGVDYVPSYLDRQDDWDDRYRDASKIYLRLKSIIPQASETIRVTYTALHTHDTVTDTVKAADHEALYDLSAYFACLALGSAKAGVAVTGVGSVRYDGKGSQSAYANQAGIWLASYNRRMGIADADSTPAASATVDWDTQFQNTRMPRLTHNPRFR